MPTSPTAPAGALRADARRNHEQVLAAAREVFVRQGAGAPLEDVAQRAGVGIATVYRRFGDREGLLRAVVHRALADARSAAEAARAMATGDGLDALSRYMRTALDLRVSAVVPLALDRLDLEDEELAEARESSARALERLIRDAHEDGSLDPDVGFADIGTLLVRLSRPLPGPVTGEVDDELAHRHLDLVLAGLRSDSGAVGGRGLTRDELHDLRDAPEDD